MFFSDFRQKCPLFKKKLFVDDFVVGVALSTTLTLLLFLPELFAFKQTIAVVLVD